MRVKKLNKLGQEIFEKRYAYPGETTYQERCRVMAHSIASAETDDEKQRVEDAFYEILSLGDFVPGGRIIKGAGTKSQNMLNCYVLIPEDNVESIGKVIQDAYRISCAGGGIGFNFSKIRPKGDDIQHNKNSAPGSVSVMRMINEIGNHVRAGGNRRTALMGILNVTHPDILEFLHVKLAQGELTNFNISVAITNRFIEAVKANEEWYFTFGNKKYYVYEVARNPISLTGGEVVKVIALSEEDALSRANECHKVKFDDIFMYPRKSDFKARDLWDLIWTNSVKSGDPGIYNIDLANEYTNVSYFERLDSTNPCGEISLPNYGNCCLGNINLANMVVDGRFDWKRFAKAVRYGLQFLDNVLEINHFPIPECKEAGHRSRRVGLGVMGYHYMLIKLGIRYGSEKCLEFTELLGKALRDIAYLKSVYLAREKGAFPAFNAKAYLNEGFAKSLPARIRMLIKEHGIRNAVMLTIPPTGTISMLMGVSSGIEPIFSPIYKRRWRDANVWKEKIVVDPLLREFYSEGLPIDVFVGAADITPKEHLSVQAAWQKFIDSCISKTINLPETATAEDLNQLALDHVEYLKGLTIYRDGSHGEAPLTPVPVTLENLEKYIEKDKVDLEVSDGALCKIGGECGS